MVVRIIRGNLWGIGEELARLIRLKEELTAFKPRFERGFLSFQTNIDALFAFDKLVGNAIFQIDHTEQIAMQFENRDQETTIAELAEIRKQMEDRK